MRKVFLENLPKKNGINNINWSSCIGYFVKFVYDNIEGCIEIVDYKNPIIKIAYNNIESEIYISNFQRSQLARILNKQSSEFKIEIGTRLQDNKRDITITDRECKENEHGRRKKWYKYKCNVCTWEEGWIEESNLLTSKQGCSCCRGLTIVEGINDIPTVANWMVKYFVGGYEEAKLYTKSSGKSIYPICPDCGRIKDKPIKISRIYNQHSIGCSCSDGISYGEKFVFSVFEQLSIEFHTQLNKTTFKWCDKYKYDFYFNLDNEQYIVEVNGLQHYLDTSGVFVKTLKEEQENDRLKKELAIKNGIKPKNYIVIDCRESTLEWIKNNEHGILNSRLKELFDLSKIDWLKAEEFTCSNLVKEICNLKKNNIDLTTTKIGEITGYNRTIVKNWLKKGSKLNWCDYNAKEEKEKSKIKALNTNSKQVEIFKDGVSLGTFNSIRKLSGLSKGLFNITLSANCISAVCKGEYKQHKGFTFKYVEGKEAC